MLYYVSKGVYDFIHNDVIYSIYRYRDAWQVFYEGETELRLYVGTQPTLVKTIEMIKGGQ